MIILLLLVPFLVQASPPVHWSTMIEVVERHEFYQDNEVLSKPTGSWQTLFGIVYPDRNLNLHKDCVFYKVPGEDPGRLKIKTVATDVPCEEKIEEKGDQEIGGLKALQFSFIGNEISLHFTEADFKVTDWKIPVANSYTRPIPKLFLSSAEYRAPKLIMLAPVRPASSSSKAKLEDKNNLCHAISDNCEELSPSSCSQCPQGWYEVPNGCPQGPKYCGDQLCGLKNRPACRRGTHYQREEKKFECRGDNSFAYCRSGLKIQCEGALAWCR